VVVMEFGGSHLIAEFKPDIVQEFDLFECQVGRMGAKIENMLLAVWRVDFEGQLRLWLGQALPSQPCNTSFLGNLSRRRKSENNARGSQALRSAQDAVPFVGGRGNRQVDGLPLLLGQR